MAVARPFSLNLLRILSAALLTLALLSSAVPFAALSASAHACNMPCCADGACTTGACDVALFKAAKKVEEEKLCGAEDKSQAHGSIYNQHSTPPAKATEDSEHCHAEKNEAAPNKQAGLTARASVISVEKRVAVVTARALSSPCPEDCCAGAVTSTQSRRGRDAALLARAAISVTPPTESLKLYKANLQPATNAHLKRLRARAPPSLNSSNPA